MLGSIVPVPVAPLKSRTVAHYVANGETSEGVPTTVELWYLVNDVDHPDTTDYTEHLDVTYHYSDIYEDDKDVTVTESRNVSHMEMNKTLRISVRDYGYKPYTR